MQELCVWRQETPRDESAFCVSLHERRLNYIFQLAAQRTLSYKQTWRALLLSARIKSRTRRENVGFNSKVRMSWWFVGLLGRAQASWRGTVDGHSELQHAISSQKLAKSAFKAWVWVLFGVLRIQGQGTGGRFYLLKKVVLFCFVCFLLTICSSELFCTLGVARAKPRCKDAHVSCLTF